MTTSFWELVQAAQLRQGDLLWNCEVPLYDEGAGSLLREVTAHVFDLVVLTQSCDLEQGRARLVACCPVFRLVDFESANPEFLKRGVWEAVRKGRCEGLHLLASPDVPADNRQAVVVDFREVYSLPLGYLQERAVELGDRWRLKSPYLEHFSQAFARFFMRVGLPAAIPPYK